MSEPVSCRNFESLAMLHAIGELDSQMRAAVEQHAQQCPDCAAMLQREAALSCILQRSDTVEQQPSDDALLDRCRRDLSKRLDEAFEPRALIQPSGWRGWLRRNWVEPFRISVRFHPGWSIAMLLVVAIASGAAGWHGIGRWPLTELGPTVVTVFAAPPPPVALAVPESAPAPAQVAPQSASAPDSNSPVYTATDAALGGTHLMDAPGADTENSPEDLMLQMPRYRLRRGVDIPRLAFREPRPRVPSSVVSPAPSDLPQHSRLDRLSHRMESFWWGGIRVDPAEQQQRLLLAPPPEYPEAARRAGIEGLVTLLLRIGPDGLVEDAEVLSGEPVLGRAAAAAAQQWRYQPVRIDGESSGVLTSVTLSFQLR